SNPGRLGDALKARGFVLDRRAPTLGDRLPDSLDDYAGSVVFGGPMSANDDRMEPGLRAEYQWFETMLQAEKPFIGVCLGAQMLARTLGRTVAAHPDGAVEIGYSEIFATDEGRDLFPRSMHVYQFHREGLDLPAGAVRLATNQAYPNQAYRYDHFAWGIQFHPEVTFAMMQRWSSFARMMPPLPGLQPADETLASHARHDPALGHWLEGFLDRVFPATAGRKATRDAAE
ncbi:MAG: hypothetical protein RII27_05530, partial [Alphaproteobacteria bacterium]